MGAKQSSPADASGGETDASASARAAAPPSAGATKPRAGLDAAARDLSAALPAAEPAAAPVGGRILLGSQTGTARRLAHKLANSLETRHGVRLETTDASGYDPEDLVREPVVLVLLSTYEDAEGNAVAPESARWLCRWAEESARDERFGALHLKDTRFAVFGCGNREYGAARFNAAARRLDQDLARLGGERVLRRADGDESSGRMEEQFHEWADKLGERLKKAETREKGDASVASDAPRFGAGKGRPRGSVAKKDEGSPTSVVADDTAEGRAYDTEEEEGSGDERGEDDDAALEAGSEDDMDMEDIGGGGGGGERREMVTPQLRAALTKQGYKILGSHSGVKLCRWTKAQLRGRGGCYKHSFYGIESHRCMEATPSLACANKCVFCWRHHTNPVGREWRWQMDDAETLVTSAISEHKGMIKQMKGVPGVLPERLAEGMDPRHCALSLVGEPIMYPEIDKFVSLLHAKRISTFLVTNAQFPDAITNLPPITQLYVSVDAATPETLKAIDRPLFGDYWVRRAPRTRIGVFFFSSEGGFSPESLRRRDARGRLFVKQRLLLRWALDCREAPTRTSAEDPARVCPFTARDNRRPHARDASSRGCVFFFLRRSRLPRVRSRSHLAGSLRGVAHRAPVQEPAHGVPPDVGRRLERVRRGGVRQAHRPRQAGPHRDQGHDLLRRHQRRVQPHDEERAVPRRRQEVRRGALHGENQLGLRA